MTNQKAANCSSAFQTAGEIFPDGAVIELLRDLASPEHLTLVRRQAGTLQLKPEVSHADRTYEPMHVNRSVSKAIRFPTRVATPEPTRKLFTAVHKLFSSRLGQLDSCVTAMVFAVFASWMSPLLPMAPILSIFAPAGSPKDSALQLLGVLCRRPLRLAGLKRGELLRVPMSLQPTLLLDETDLRPAMQSILEAGTQKGSYVPSSDGMRDLFGPKIVCSRKPLLGTELEAHALRIALIPVSEPLPILDTKVQEDLAEEFQARFLGYFLGNCGSVQIPKFDVGGLAPPFQGLARAFGAAVVGDEELQAKIIPLLSVQDEEIRSNRASAFDSVVVEAGLFFIHQGGWSKVRAESTAEKVEAIYKGRGSDREVSPESVGWAWKRLRIPSGRINRAGNGIELTVPTCRLIHQLAISFGVRAIQGGPRDDCRFCRELEKQPKT